MEIAYTDAKPGKGCKAHIVVEKLSECEDQKKIKIMAEGVKEICAGKTAAEIKKVLKKDVRGIEKLSEAELEALVADLASTVGVSGAGQTQNDYVEKAIEQYEKYAKDQTKVQGTYRANAQESTVLKAEIENRGVDNPPYPSSSHHIVGANESRAADAREILLEVGIDLNSAANGVNLPNRGARGNENVTTESMHTGRHKRDAVKETNHIIVQAKKKRLRETGRPINAELDPNDPDDVKAITDAIHKVRIKLLKGEIKLNN